MEDGSFEEAQNVAAISEYVRQFHEPPVPRDIPMTEKEAKAWMNAQGETYGSVSAKVATLETLDWTFTVYIDGSLKIETPKGREEFPCLKCVIGGDLAKSLATLFYGANNPSGVASEASKDFGELNPASLGRVG